jgi:hypothetical protein
MSNFFKKVGRDVGGLFKKNPSGSIAKAFGKSGQIARGISSGLAQTSKVLGQVGNVGSKLLNNPAVAGALMATAPELYLPAQGLLGAAKGLSGVASMGANLSNPSTYKKATSIQGHLENLKDAKKRLEDTKEAASNISFA